MSQIFLFIRMAIYVFAVPVAAYLGGTFDPDTGILTIDVNHVMNLIGGLVVAGSTYLSGRVAKRNGGAT